MTGTTVRVTTQTREILRELARETNEPMQDVLEKAIEAYRRQRLLELTNVAYAELRADPRGWTEEQAERSFWDGTLVDGLEPE